MLKHGPITIERLGHDTRVRLRKARQGEDTGSIWSAAEIKDLPRKAWGEIEETGKIGVSRYGVVEAVLEVVP